MSAQHPSRTPLFRLITIAASGLGSLIIGLVGLSYATGGGAAEMSPQTLGSIIVGLCALSAAGAAVSFFAGVDESASFVFQETQIDKLTGLPSRAAMVGYINRAAQATLADGEPSYLVDIDIDRFKQINDAIGYAQGDELIRAVTGRLKASLPQGTLLGRIGAGEFAIIFSDRQVGDGFAALADRLIAALSEPYQLATHSQSVNVSLGIVAMPKDGVDAGVLLRRSNLALQNARAGGVGNWAVFSPDMGRVADYRQWIEAELGTAFERGDLDLHYQPQMNLLTGSIVGYEALLRWKHPERGMIPPVEFVPVAEETGMIAQIGRWVLARACADAKRLPADCFIAVNISPVQLTGNGFVAMVREIVASSGIDPARLELEVTETAIMQDRSRAASVLSELAAMGISVAVDDFGTGYSNLSYLIDFEFQKLKIDRSFVTRLDGDASSGAVVSTIVGLSRALGVRTIAEGVETEEQATLLRAAGCEVVQGYLFGRPAPLQAEAEGAPAPERPPGKTARVAAVH